MNKKETAQILTYLRELYPQGAPITEDTVNVWQDLFSDIPYELVWASVKVVAKTWDGYTMPPPAVIFNAIREINPEDYTPIELWRIAEKGISHGTIFTQREFDEWPGPLQRYFGGPSAIKDLALLNKSELSNERARFLKAAPDLMRRDELQRALPADVKIMLESIAKQLPDGE